MIRLKNFISKGDRKLLVLFLKLRSLSKLNLFMRGITVFGGAVFTISSTLLLLLFTKDQLRQTSILAAFGLTGSFLIVQWVKRLVKRFRPYLVMAEIKLLGKPLADHSFPSGHTTSIFSLSTAFSLSYPQLSFWLYGLASLVGVSRIYLGFHYPSDVAAGILIGTGFTIGASYVLGFTPLFLG